MVGQQIATNNAAQLELNGECGFGRECVGVLVNGLYPDYHWYDDDDHDYKQEDDNGDVWSPEYAYHKHECVAVLGHGESSEAQLYDWLKWFDDNGFKLESGEVKGVFDPIKLYLENIIIAEWFSRLPARWLILNT